MSKMKLAALAHLAAALSIQNDMFLGKGRNIITRENIDITPKKLPIPKGCKKYIFKELFGTLEVIAMNEKSALKKYNKWCDKNKIN